MNRSPELLRRERLGSLVLRVSLEQVPMRSALGTRRNFKAIGFEMVMNENVFFMNNAG